MTSTPIANARSLVERAGHVDTSGGHRLHLRIVEPQPGLPRRRSVLALHGLFSDGRFFLNAAQQGPGRFFLDRGHPLLVGELRGHGRSQWPAGRRRWDWSFDDYAQHDIPALLTAAAEFERGPVFALAHSIAGYALLAGLGHRPDTQRLVAAACLVSSAVNDYTESGWRKRIVFHGCAALARMAGRFPAKALRAGVADEPAPLMRQFVQWAARQGFASRDGRIDYWRCLRDVHTPVFAAVGAADRFHASPRRGRLLVERLGSEDKRFVELGPNAGFSRSFGHVDVLRGAAAREEVLPRLASWMDSHEPPWATAAYG